MAFTLHPQLQSDTRPVMSLTLNDLLLMNDRRYLWCLLVPRLPGLRDLHDVPEAHKARMFREIDQVSAAIREVSQAYKMNVAALGNMVEQLHVHVIARHRDDPAWPGPVWGVGQAESYTDEQATERITKIRGMLSV